MTTVSLGTWPREGSGRGVGGRAGRRRRQRPEPCLRDARPDGGMRWQRCSTSPHNHRPPARRRRSPVPGGPPGAAPAQPTLLSPTHPPTRALATAITILAPSLAMPPASARLPTCGGRAGAGGGLTQGCAGGALRCLKRSGRRQLSSPGATRCTAPEPLGALPPPPAARPAPSPPAPQPPCRQRAHHEARDILQEQQRDLALRAQLHEVGAL
jgi:hypothetical protein